jgi:hypothetical protein
MGTPLDSVLFTLRLLMVMVTIRITAMGAITKVDTIAAGSDRPEWGGLLKKTHLRCSPHPSSLQRTSEYASLLRISGALHLGLFEQPVHNDCLKEDASPIDSAGSQVRQR